MYDQKRTKMSANLNFRELAKRYYKAIGLRFSENMVNTLKICTTLANGAVITKCLMDSNIEEVSQNAAIITSLLTVIAAGIEWLDMLDVTRDAPVYQQEKLENRVFRIANDIAMMVLVVPFGALYSKLINGSFYQSLLFIGRRGYPFAIAVRMIFLP